MSKCTGDEPPAVLRGNPKGIGIAADHGGYELKEYLRGKLRDAGHEVVDSSGGRPKENDDYPDFIVPLAPAMAEKKRTRRGQLWRRVGASVCANKVAGVRACLIHENFSEPQGVEDDGLDAFIFAGGIGANAPVFRARIYKGLSFLSLFLSRGNEVAQNDAVP